MSELDNYITRYLRPYNGEFFETAPADEYEWTQHDVELFETESGPSFPRVVPPERAQVAKRKAVPMAHDGGPGVKDHSLIKSVLRRSGLL